MGGTSNELGAGQPHVPASVRGGRLLRRVRVGIVGCGWVSRHRHVPAYRRSGVAEIAAVYDRKSERAEALARYAHARPYSRELEEMLSKEQLDVVSVCTPPWLHASQTVMGLEAGANVLVEKPMAMTETDCKAMCDAARRNARKLCVRSEEHTSELQSRPHLVCRLLLEKKTMHDRIRNPDVHAALSTYHIGIL